MCNCTEIAIFHCPVFGKHCMSVRLMSIHYFGLMCSLEQYHIKDSQTGHGSELLWKMVIGSPLRPRSLRLACTNHRAGEHAHMISCFSFSFFGHSINIMNECASNLFNIKFFLAVTVSESCQNSACLSPYPVREPFSRRDTQLCLWILVSLSPDIASENHHTSSIPGYGLVFVSQKGSGTSSSSLMFSGFAPVCLDRLDLLLLIPISTHLAAKTHLSSAVGNFPSPFSVSSVLICLSVLCF